MATRPARYKCVLGGYKVFEVDGTTEITTYKEQNIHGNNAERQTDVEGVYDDVAETLTFPNGDVIHL